LTSNEQAEIDICILWLACDIDRRWKQNIDVNILIIGTQYKKLPLQV